MGAGLSSSAALEVAAARVFAAVSGVTWDHPVAARLGLQPRRPALPIASIAIATAKSSM